MDNHSTTPLDSRVLEAMLPYFGEKFGNAANRSHSFGWEASEAVEKARAEVAGAIGARPDEIVFTSGATESNNAALFGIAEACRTGGDHIVTCATEHPAVLDPVTKLEQCGYRVTRLPVDRYGRVDPSDIDGAIQDGTILVSLMTANNEIGTIHPVDEIGEVTRNRGVLFHSDAAQALGKVPFDVERLKVDLVSLSAHKIHGPKGVGAMYVRGEEKDALAPLLLGGGHERGFRSGTLNVPGIVGMGEAARLAVSALADEPARLGRMTERLLVILNEGLDDVSLNGPSDGRLPNNLNVSFQGVDGEALLLALDDVGVSTGSACMSAAGEPSHVLGALGLNPDRVRSSIRFGLGRFNTEEEVEYVGRRVVEAVRRLRRLTPGHPVSRT
jgi:cysteine desulfurase